MRIITTTDDLAEFTADLKKRPFVAVDTEFMREKTYWPILCLIQAAADGAEAIIDPMAKGLDLSPFLDLLRDSSTTKVFHAARQDVEIFYNLLGEVPAPLFDTQVAAMACGFGDQIGYEPLMRTLVGAHIDKGSRFTDWARRPLSESQLTYALSDVTHLRDAYPILMERLETDGRWRWVEEEMSALNDAGLYKVEPEHAWKRLKLRGVRPNDLGPIMKLAEWRELEAQDRDTPRGRVMKDEAILELARQKPNSPEELSQARTIPRGFERSRSAEHILHAIAAGKKIDRSALPKIEKNERRAAPPADVVELLKVLLKRQSEKFGIASRLIASNADLDAIALGDHTVKAMSGWRNELFGELALKLIAGGLALKLTNGAVEVIDTDDQPS
ncbi:MAG: ribonuclease D [Parvularculaceae bacterium]|nr:ribonuclease D [Parvularculaceae bacterium]